MWRGMPALLLVIAAFRPVLSGAQVASDPFRYDERSGRCRDAGGREGHNPGSREALERTGHGECGDFSARGLNLTYLRLTGANLRGARFTGVPWYLGSINDSDLTGAELSHTTGQMEYRGSRLRAASLLGADLTHADLDGVDLDGADLRGARFGPHTRLPFDHDTALRRGMVFVPPGPEAQLAPPAPARSRRAGPRAKEPMPLFELQAWLERNARGVTRQDGFRR